MPEGISISLAEVSAAASAIRSTNAQLVDTLAQIKTQMGNTSQTWQSDAGNTIRDRFNALAPKFDQYREVVDSYAKFLDMTVTSYDQTETNINSAASSFK
jgi:WXG100 family type VII secretion target